MDGGDVMKSILLTVLRRVALIAIIVFAARSVYAQVEVDKYYFYDGRTLLTVYNEDPRQVDPKQHQILYWEIRLYKRGEPTGGHNYWGSISGKSANSVLNQLKREQDFQKQYAKWIGRDYEDEEFTHFNPLGPIARTKLEPTKVQPSSKDQALVQQLEKYYERLKPLYDLFSNIQKVLSKQPRQNNPFRGVGKVTKEYADNLAHATAHIRKLQAFFAGPVMTDQLSKLSNELDGFITNAESLMPEVKNLLDLKTQDGVRWKSVTTYTRNDRYGTEIPVTSEQTVLIQGDHLIWSNRDNAPEDPNDQRILQGTYTCQLSAINDVSDISFSYGSWGFIISFSSPCKFRIENLDRGTVSHGAIMNIHPSFEKESDALEARTNLTEIAK